MNEQKIMKILLAPLLSEKSTVANANNQYVFQVAKDATKPEIKAAVEKLFNVNVVAVQVINIKPKNVKLGRTEGKLKAWKKAYVRVAQGQEIDFAGAQA